MIEGADLQYSSVNLISLSRVGCREEQEESICGMSSTREEQSGESKQNPS